MYALIELEYHMEIDDYGRGVQQLRVINGSIFKREISLSCVNFALTYTQLLNLSIPTRIKENIFFNLARGGGL